MNPNDSDAAGLSPDCPRCGYDLSGSCSQWKTECPLRGSCSECGLDFAWGEVLSPVARIPAWFLEHPHRRIWRTFLPTYLRALLPWKFWRVVRLEFPIRRWRLSQFVLEIAVVIHVLAAYFTIAAVYSFSWPLDLVSGTGVPQKEAALMAALPYVPVAVTKWGSMNIPAPSLWTLLTVALSALVPVMFLILWETRRHTRVRFIHLARVAVYSLAPLPLFLALQFAVQARKSRDFIPGRSIADQVFYYVEHHIGRHVSLQLILFSLFGLWLAADWWAAARRYLRFPHAGGVALVMVGMAWVSCIIVVALVDGMTLFDTGR